MTTLNERASSSPPSHTGNTQYTTLHALRGLAALWVVMFHISRFGAFGSVIQNMPQVLRVPIFDFGRGGVAVFFVVSGFVIAHSLRDAVPNAAFLAHFALRRSIRLDPAYWASIALAIATLSLSNWRHHLSIALPSVGTLLAHISYSQELLRFNEIQIVYWSLTYEVQFYLVAVLALWLHKAGKRGGGLLRIAGALIFPILFAAAVVAGATASELFYHGLFLNYWHAFCAGLLAYIAGIRRSNLSMFLVIMLSLVMLASAARTNEIFNSPAAFTALGLAIAGRAGGLCRLKAPLLQMLGTVSYSLYLTHVTAIFVANSLLASFAGRGGLASALAFLCVVALCLMLAATLWYLVEQPTHQLAKRVRLRATMPVREEAPAVAA